ncbi:MAG: hypothetical protein KGJ59_09810, partial [Bacteroidota bacterium]|nr:hypothetical protein [Bacteroidota bacterium]
LLSLTYLVFIIAIFFVPLVVFFRAAYFRIEFPSAMLLAATAALAAVTAMASFVSHVFGVRSLRRDF